jgi:protein-disulfide isomerase
MSELHPPVTHRDHMQGPPDAALVLVEFGDYECSHCKAAYPVVKAIQAELGPQLCFVYRHFPLVEIHPYALVAAQAAQAAGAQGRFWQMHHALFQNSPALALNDLLIYAAAIELDLQQFVQSLRTRAFLPRVEEDIESSLNSGVSGTPMFFINGVRHQGGYDLASLLEALRVAQ